MNINKEVYDNYTSPMCNNVNFGSGKDPTFKELADTIKEVLGFKGGINFDPSRPNGINKKLLDIKN